MAKKRILTDFRLDKISIVDFPCQEHARVAIIKRRDDDMTDITKKQHDDAIATLVVKHKEDTDKLSADIAKLQTAHDDAIAKAKMSDDEKEYCESLKDDEKKKFLAKSADERKAEIAKAKSGDEVITVNGVSIRKSATDPVVFDILKAQEKRNADNELAIVKANDVAETATIEKRVHAEFSHIPGKPADIAKVLKAAAKMPDDVRVTFETVLKSAEQMAARGFEKIGVSLGEIRKGQQPLNDKVDEIMKSRKISKVDAMMAAAQEFPDLYEAYQNAGTDAARRAA